MAESSGGNFGALRVIGLKGNGFDGYEEEIQAKLRRFENLESVKV